MSLSRLQTLYLALALTLAVLFSTILQQTAGWLPTIIIGVGAFGLGIIFWARTSLRYPTDPKRLLPPYLLTAAMLMVHIAEEYAFAFGDRIAGITGGQWSNEEFLWTLGLGFPLVWILGVYAIARRHEFGGFMSWFIFSGMLLGEPTHLLIFPIREALLFGGRYGYFPGMWTALLPLVTGVWGIWVIISDTRRQEREAMESTLQPHSSL